MAIIIVQQDYIYLDMEVHESAGLGGHGLKVLSTELLLLFKSQRQGMQSKKQSALESLISSVTGYVLAMCLYMFILPLYGHTATWEQSFQITAAFTIVGILRTYIIRRIFNKIAQIKME